jgi:transcriptional regulator with XRE-family HTH domain
MPKLVVDVEALHGALDAKRQAQGLSWRDLASELDLSASTFTRMAQGQRPDIDAFATLLAWLNMPAERYTRSVGAVSAGQVKDQPLVEITTLLGSSSAIKRSEAEALNNIITAAYKSIVKE